MSGIWGWKNRFHLISSEGGDAGEGGKRERAMT